MQQFTSPPSRPLRFAGVRNALGAFADPNYRWYWLASFCYYTGVFMEVTASPQLAYDLTGQAFLLGVAALSNGVPFALLSLLGGTMADRMPKKGILVGAQIILASTGVMICLLLFAGLLEYWQLIVFGVIRGMATGFSLPGRLAMVGEVIEERQFLKAYSLYYVALNTMSIGGPAIAGTIIGLTGGTTMAYLIIGIAHLLGLFGLMPVFTRKLPPPKPTTSVLQDMGATFAFAWGSPTILILMGAGLGITFFSMSLIPLLPVFADKVFNAPHGVGLAALQAAAGVGGLVGAGIITSLSQVKRKPLMLLIAGLAQGVTLLLFAATSWLPLGTALMGLRGISASCYMTLNSTLFQLNSTPELRGRSMSLYLLGNALQPIAVLPISLSADTVGPQLTVSVVGVLLILYMVVVAVRFPAFRRERI